ncbi:hypothetical protein INR49_030547 [Caranx melampygus]|nr:hypothetical protein INR49_030547 [Caranx melampygus]
MDYSYLVQMVASSKQPHPLSQHRDMWWALSLLLMVALVVGTEVSQSEDAGSMVAVEMAKHQENFSDISAVLGNSRHQILAAQFECYLKIISDPPRTDEGTYCNRTWDGWLCWGDTAPGTAMQMCPEYFIDFDPAVANPQL